MNHRKANMFGTLKRYINKKISDRNYRLAQEAAVREYFYDIKNSTLPELTEEEKKLIQEKWSRIIPDPSVGYQAFRVFKKYDKFDVNYIPEPYFYPHIIRILNPVADYISLPNKGLTDSLFSGLSRPETILKKTGSNWLKGDENSPIGSEDIIPSLLNQHSDLIIKPSKDTNSGRGVRLIPDKTDKEELNSILSSYSSDFIIQKKVVQSEFTAQFNSTSVNTFRIVTLFINNRLSLCYGVLKLGGAGNIVDNGANGALWVGIGKDGILNDWGTDFQLQFSTSHNGVSLKDKVVPDYQSIIDLAFRAHRQIPVCGLVAWDIALDHNDTPLIIEANLWWPSTSFGEICNGPAFGDRTDEVIDYVSEHELPILGLSHKI